MAEVTGMTPDRIAQEIKDNTWHNGPVPSTVQSMDELAVGSWGIASMSVARDLGLPGNFGTLEIQQIANGKTATYISQKNNTQELSIWISSRNDTEWTPWEKLLKHSPQERLSGDIDLNTLTDPNTYGITINSGVLNLPEGEENTAGVLEVLTTGNRSIQRLTTWSNTPKIYIRVASDGTDWYGWRLVYPDPFERLSGDIDLNTLTTPTTYGIAINSGVLNLPEGEENTAGVLEIMSTGNRSMQRLITWSNTPKIYVRAQSSGTDWYGWKRQLDETDIEQLLSGGSPGLKTSATTLTAHSLTGGVPGRYRILAHITAPVTRFRIHIESRRMVYETTRDFTLNNVYIGKHTGNGNITDSRTLKTGSTNISGTSEWVSEWIKYDLTSEVLVDFNVSGSNLLRYYAGGYEYESGTWKPTTIVSAAVWLELETYSETPVVAMIGDSTGAGQGAELAIHESALHMAARKHKFIPMNYSYPGSTMRSMNNIDHHIYKRWVGLSKPDSVIIQAGSNDIHGGAPIDELKTRFRDISKLAEGISPVVIATTVKARYPDSGSTQNTLNEYNQWIRTQPYESRDYLDFYQAVSPNGGTLLADKADAAHLKTSGHSKMASVFDNVVTSRPPADVEYKGTGSPEGKVSAPVGSTYTDSAATNGAIRWIKTSGTGNTGWRDDYGDTTAALEAKADKTYVDTVIEDSRRSRQLGSDEDLNSLTTNQRAHTINSTTAAKTELHYPPDAVHGYVDVVVISSTYFFQTWTDTWNGFTATRRSYNGTWTDWEIDVTPSDIENLQTQIDALEETPEQPDSGAVYGDFHPQPVTGGTVGRYWHSPAGTSYIPPEYQGEGLVGRFARATGYSKMMATKHGHNLRVSCINETTNRHVTYTIEGGDSSTLSYRDDFHIIRDIFVGAVANGVPSMDTEIMGRSNTEWAFQIDLNGVKEFVPYHGTPNTYYEEPMKLEDVQTGDEIILTSLYSGNTVENLNGLRMTQHVRIEHSSDPGVTIAKSKQVTTITPDGLLQSETVLTAEKDFTIGSNYAPMTPVEFDVVDQFTTGKGEVHTLADTVPSSTFYTDVAEGEDFTTGVFTGSTAFAAVAFLHPRSTWAKDLPTPNSDLPLRLETRASPSMFKLYPTPFSPDSKIHAGTVWRLGAQWRYGESDNPQQYL